ncbi:HHL119Cp [Eremothecium sinecaudum]|uniref:HHL119Cp n=1 Tax=Eremothecium sinecaudum TaxID=45286 RepID=A0A109UYH7_9SACH|nr:HHL119Cp [Eremothecium sinecaudum]AMD22651.1 HHL119Cp [Eremothecium sinecaudum]
MLMRRGMTAAMRYYDIGFNMCDPMYQGVYNGKKYHETDIDSVLKRCEETRVDCLLLTGSSIAESRETIKMAEALGKKHSKPRLFYTVGVHPCCVNEFVIQEGSTIHQPTNDEEWNSRLDVTDYGFTRGKLLELYELMSLRHSSDTAFRAIGEIGLDYDRFYYSGKRMQLKFFREQLKLSCLFPEMPLFLHMRSAFEDFIAIMREFVSGFTDNEDLFNWKELIAESDHCGTMLDASGSPVYRFDPRRKFVVHSFTGTPFEMHELLALSSNCYIGMNGTSFKDEHNIESARQVPLERLLLETDAPWCEIKRTHVSYPYLMRAENAVSDSTTPWLKEAYPDLEKWYDSVKRDKLVKKDQAVWPGTMVKSRNEPCTMGQVATVVANVKGLPLKDVVSQVWETSCAVYGD